MEKRYGTHVKSGITVLSIPCGNGGTIPLDLRTATKFVAKQHRNVGFYGKLTIRACGVAL
jgi:hypothetical protein